jgi:hypothetical protein
VTALPLLLAAATAPNRTLAIVLLSGMAALSIGLAILMWTRWGQAQPLAKCVGLSVFAHLLLLVYAYATQVFYDVPGNSDSDVLEVRLIHTGDDEDASPWADPEAAEIPPDDLTRIATGAGNDDGVAEPETGSALVARAAPGAAAPPLLEAPPAEDPKEADATASDSPQPTTVEELASTMTNVTGPQRSETSSPAEERIAELPSEMGPTDSIEPETSPPMLDRRERTELADASRTDSVVAPSTIPFAAPPPAPSAAAAVLRRTGDGQAMPKMYSARIAADRVKIAEQHGGDVNTEAAVNAALHWLATHQSADGRWDADAYGAGRETGYLGHDRGGAGAKADTGITGLALLALLGAGNTHLEGTYRENVQHGLEFLLMSQHASGSLQGDAELFASMYCHGIATLALSEAYAMTGDPRLSRGLHKAIQYTVDAQHSAGGWRYQPGDPGDMSQFGWQVMALKSAELGGLPIPDETRVRMTRFLRSVTSGRQRGLASYRPGERPSRTMTAEALVCRTLAGIENSPAAMEEGTRFILEELPGSTPTNLYYYYYATLALYQRQGSDWDRWNTSLQRELLQLQRRDGDMTGSWDPDANWGSYGGRVYSTALGALCLEVYYRYLPLYEGDIPAEPRWTERLQWPASR